MKKKKWLVMVTLVFVFSLMFGTTVSAAGTGDVAGAIEGTWNDASEQIKTVVNKVVFPAIDLILAVFFFIQWCKQVIGICMTAFLQSTILTAGLMVFKDHPLLGLGLMLSSTEVPRIAGQFGLDTSTKTNIMSSVYAAQTAINMTRTVVKAVAA